MTRVPSSVRRRIAWVVAAAVLLAACSDDGSADASDDTAADDAAEASTETTEGADDAPDPGAPPDFEGAIAAMAEVESVEVESVYGMEGGGVDRFELTMRGELGPDDVASLVMSSDLAGLEIEVRSDGRTAWVTSTDPSFTEALPAGARWVETSVDELRDQGFWEGSDSFVALLPVLRGLGDLEDAGTTEIGGDEVRLWTGPVDLEAARSASSPEEAELIDQNVELRSDFESVTATVGVDGEGRVRTLRLETTGGSGEEPWRIWMGFTLHRVGQEVDAPEPPPAEETVPLAEAPGALDILGVEVS